MKKKEKKKESHYLDIDEQRPGLRPRNPPERHGNAAKERREFGSGRQVRLEQNDDIEDATNRED